MSLTSLPVELFLVIAGFLTDDADRQSLRLTCKSFLPLIRRLAPPPIAPDLDFAFRDFTPEDFAKAEYGPYEYAAAWSSRYNLLCRLFRDGFLNPSTQGFCGRCFDVKGISFYSDLPEGFRLKPGEESFCARCLEDLLHFFGYVPTGCTDYMLMCERCGILELEGSIEKHIERDHAETTRGHEDVQNPPYETALCTWCHGDVCEGRKNGDWDCGQLRARPV